MKRIIITVIMLLLLSVMTDNVCAVETGVITEQSNALGLDGLQSAVNSQTNNILADLEISEDIDINAGLGRIFETGKNELGGIIKNALRSAVIILMIAILCAVADTVYESTSISGGVSYVQLAGVVAISAVAVGDVTAFMGLGNNVLDNLNTMSKLVLPTLSAAATASGAFTSAAAKYAATSLFMDVLISVATGILMPVIYAYIAAVIAEAAIGGEGLNGAANFLKWLATTILILIVLAFTIYLSVSGIVTSTADAMTVRVAKTTLSTTLPVIGSIISDAASSVLAGASVLKNAIGIFGMLTIIAMCIIPFLHLAAHYILYKASSKLSAAVSGGRISKLISGIGNAFGMVMGLTGSCAIMLFFSFMSLIKVVTPG